MKVWVMVFKDRHIDDVIKVSKSELGRDAVVEQWMASFEQYSWHTHRNRTTGAIEYAYTTDDGPRIDISHCKVQP